MKLQKGKLNLQPPHTPADAAAIKAAIMTGRYKEAWPIREEGLNYRLQSNKDLVLIIIGNGSAVHIPVPLTHSDSR